MQVGWPGPESGYHPDRQGAQIKAVTTQQEAAFPFTLALSLREREWRSTVWDYALNAGHFRALPRAHPLPEGEDRGEGEQGARWRRYG